MTTTDAQWDALLAEALSASATAQERVVVELRASLQTDPARFDELLDTLVETSEGATGQAFVLRIVHDLGLARPAIAQVITDPWQIDDVEQLTMEKLERSLASFAGRSRFRTWLFRVARNEALQQVRRRRSDVDIAVGGTEEPVLPNPRRLSSRIADRANLIDAMGRLSADHRQILLLRGEQGMSYEDIAKRLDLNLNTVRTRLRAARIRLAEELTGDDH